MKKRNFVLAAAVMLATILSGGVHAAAPKFEVEEKTIAQVQQAISSKQITTRGVVEAYLKLKKTEPFKSLRLHLSGGKTGDDAPYLERLRRHVNRRTGRRAGEYFEDVLVVQKA